MWIISTIFSIISIICFYQDIKFLIIIGAVLVIADNLFNTIYGKQNNLVNLFISIFIGILLSLIFHHSILYFTCLIICSVNIIEGILGILLLLFGFTIYNKYSKENNNEIGNPNIDSDKVDGEYSNFIQDNFSNDGTKTYMRDIKLPSNEVENDLEKQKYEYLLDILKRKIGVEDVDDAIHQLYRFYASQNIYIPIHIISNLANVTEKNKLEALLKILQTGMGTNNIDDTIEELEKFYNEQHNFNNIYEKSTTNDNQEEIDFLKENIKILKQTYEKAKEDLGDNTIEKAIDLHERGVITENQKNDFIDAIEGLNIIINNYPSQIATLEDKLNQLIKEKETIYCIYCGTKSNIKDKYCNNCGKKLKK